MGETLFKAIASKGKITNILITYLIFTRPGKGHLTPWLIRSKGLIARKKCTAL